MTPRVAERCLCGAGGGTDLVRFGIDVRACDECGIFRQPLDCDEDALARWYAERYHDGIYHKSYAHDVGVAEKRLAAYGFDEGARILDVGAGNGAFVDVARQAGYDARGQEPGEQFEEHPYIYGAGSLADVGFPSDYFDVVTLHDVLEHAADPRALLREIRRVLRDDGTLVVDFPRFWHPEGTHHWKPVEHIWMLDEAELRALLEESGFRVEGGDYPIPSKIVFWARRAPSEETTFLVPPGIGDGYWCATKIRGFCRDHGIELPVRVEVHDSGPKRSEGFWRRVPFVRWGGYRKLSRTDQREAERIYRNGNGPSVFRNVFGVDYFMTFNAALDHGRSVDEALPGTEPAEWRLPFFRPIAESYAAKAYRETLGPYVVTAWWERGFYRRWLSKFGEEDIVASLRAIADEGYAVVVTGAAWDENGIASRVAEADVRFHDLVGRTSFDDLTALLSGAEAVFGFPAGSTMLGPFLDRPTVLLWEERFPRAMWTNSVAPSENYLALDVDGLDPTRAAGAVIDVLWEEKAEAARWDTVGDDRMRHA